MDRCRTITAAAVLICFGLVTLGLVHDRAAGYSAARLLWAKLAPSAHVQCAIGLKGYVFAKLTLCNPSELEDRHLPLIKAIFANITKHVFSQCSSFDLFVSTYKNDTRADRAIEEFLRPYPHKIAYQPINLDTWRAQFLQLWDLLTMINASPRIYDTVIIVRLDIGFLMDLLKAPKYDPEKFNLAWQQPGDGEGGDDNVFIFPYQKFMSTFVAAVNFSLHNSTHPRHGFDFGRDLITHDLRRVLYKRGVVTNGMSGAPNPDPPHEWAFIPPLYLLPRQYNVTGPCHPRPAPAQGR